MEYLILCLQGNVAGSCEGFMSVCCAPPDIGRRFRENHGIDLALVYEKICTKNKTVLEMVLMLNSSKMLSIMEEL